jgi:hypothetical protein
MEAERLAHIELVLRPATPKRNLYLDLLTEGYFSWGVHEYGTVVRAGAHDEVGTVACEGPLDRTSSATFFSCEKPDSNSIELDWLQCHLHPCERSKHHDPTSVLAWGSVGPSCPWGQGEQKVGFASITEIDSNMKCWVPKTDRL